MIKRVNWHAEENAIEICLFDVFFLFRDHNSHAASLDRDKFYISNANLDWLQVVCAFAFRVSD